MPEATEGTMVIGKLFGRCNVPASVDPDLPIRGGGGGHPDPEIIGVERSKKIFFGPSGHSLVQKYGGRAPRAPPLDLPLTCKYIWMQPS